MQDKVDEVVIAFEDDVDEIGEIVHKEREETRMAEQAAITAPVEGEATEFEKPPVEPEPPKRRSKGWLF